MSGQGPQIQLTWVELFCLLRHARESRDRLWQDIMALQERRDRGGYDGALEGAIRALDNELYIIDEVIRKLWERTRP